MSGAKSENEDLNPRSSRECLKVKEGTNSSSRPESFQPEAEAVEELLGVGETGLSSTSPFFHFSFRLSPSFSAKSRLLSLSLSTIQSGLEGKP